MRLDGLPVDPAPRTRGARPLRYGALMLDLRVVDLTQPLGPATVLWPGSTPFAAVVDGEHGRDTSYHRTLTLAEHSGTHIDAPGHFAAGGRTTDELAAHDLVRPAVAL